MLLQAPAVEFKEIADGEDNDFEKAMKAAVEKKKITIDAQVTTLSEFTGFLKSTDSKIYQFTCGGKPYEVEVVRPLFFLKSAYYGMA